MKLFILAFAICIIALAMDAWFTTWMERRRMRDHQRLMDEYSKNPRDLKWVKDDVMSDDSLPF